MAAPAIALLSALALLFITRGSGDDRVHPLDEVRTPAARAALNAGRKPRACTVDELAFWLGARGTRFQRAGYLRLK